MQATSVPGMAGRHRGDVGEEAASLRGEVDLRVVELVVLCDEGVVDELHAPGAAQLDLDELHGTEATGTRGHDSGNLFPAGEHRGI